MNGRLRIAHVLPFPMSEKGGVSSYVRGLSGVLSADPAAEVVIIAPDRFRGGPGQRVGQVLLAFEQVRRLLRARPDVVHVHEHPALLASALIYRLLSRGSARVVHTIHVHPLGPRAQWKRVGLGWLLAHCDVVTTVSSATRAQLASVATPAPASVRVIPGAANLCSRPATDPAVLEFRARFGLGEGPVICQVSPLNFPRKVAGLLCLVEAFSSVKARVPTARLLVVGDGSLRDQVDAVRRRMRLGDSVAMTGFVDDVSIPLGATDIYCHITEHDACPLSLLEAMHSGKAVIASRSGGIPEIVTHGVDGLLVGTDPTEVAQAIASLLESPARAAEMAVQARVTIQTRFTWKTVSAEFAKVYGLPRGEKVEV